jgi:RNase H-fold protein (predicted Holliday junction resolvase)
VRLGIDYGPRTIGVALIDYFGQTQSIQALGNSGDLTNISRFILNKARYYGAVEVVVGLPLDSNGVMHLSVRNFNAQLCLNFSSVLSAIALHEYQNGIQVKLFDERYTTREAKLRIQVEKKRGM